MNKEDLKNTKFIVHDDEKEKVSNHLKALGFEDEKINIISDHENLFFIYRNNNHDMFIRWVSNYDFNWFIKNTNELITVEDILSVPLPEPKYRACENAVEAARFLGKAIYDNYSDFRYHIQSINNEDFYLTNGCGLSFGYVFNNYKLEDGTPIGVKEE